MGKNRVHVTVVNQTAGGGKWPMCMFKLLFVFNVLCAADAATTHVALNRGAHEMMLPTQNPWAIDAMVASEAIGGDLLFVWLDRQGHPKLARGLVWAAIGLRAYAVINNARVLHQLGH